MLDVSSIEAMDDETGQSSRQVVFRVPLVADVAIGDKVSYLGKPFFVRKTAKSTRLGELEMRCEALADYITTSIARMRLRQSAAG